MTKVRRNSLGFRMIKLAMLLVITIVVSTLTWYVWHTKAQAAHNLKAVSNSSAQQPVKSVTTPQQPKQTDPTTSQLQPAAGTGIKGETLMGATTGCYSPDQNSSCGKPPHVQATIDVQSKGSPSGASSTSITTMASDANGMFSIDLVPGTYFLIPKLLGNGEQASSQTITVTSGQYSTVTFIYN